MQPLFLALVDILDLSAEVLPEFLQELGLAGLEGGDQIIKDLLRFADDGLCIFLEGEFGVANVEKDGLGLLKLEEPLPCRVVDLGA